jgi:hypothetical protein
MFHEPGEWFHANAPAPFGKRAVLDFHAEEFPDVRREIPGPAYDVPDHERKKIPGAKPWFGSACGALHQFETLGGGSEPGKETIEKAKVLYEVCAWHEPHDRHKILKYKPEYQHIFLKCIP